MLFVIVSLLFASACDVGTVLANTGSGGDDDGSNCGNKIEPPPPSHPHLDDGTPHTGRGCMDAAGCHNAGLGLGSNAPEYSYAGTLYADAAGTMPAAGATVFVTAAGGTVKKLQTDDAGNFQIEPALLPAPTATMMASTTATTCPTITPMVGTLGAGQGNCNQGGTCHGGGQGKMHLP
jgi:hypothetical protein